MGGTAGNDALVGIVCGRFAVVLLVVVGVHIGKVEGPLVPLEAHTGGIVLAAVGGHHVVGVAIVVGGLVEHEAEAQGHPFLHPPFGGNVEGPVVAPMAVGEAGIGIIDIHIEVGKAAPQGIGGAGFDAQVFDGLVGYAESEGVGQMDGAVQVMLGGIKAQFAHKSRGRSANFTIHLQAHGSAVHETHSPLVVQLGVQGDVAAEGKALTVDVGITACCRSGEFHLTLFRVHIEVGRAHCSTSSCLLIGRNLLAHLHIGVENFSADANGNLVGQLIGDIGRDGAGDELNGLQVESSGPFVGVLHAKAEAGELAYAQPHLVVELMGEIPGRDGPGLVRAVVVVVAAFLVLHVHAPVHLGDGKVGLELRTLKAGHSGRVVGNNRGVAAAGHKAASKGHGAGTAFKGGGEAFGAGLLGRQGKRKGKKGAQGKRTLAEKIHRRTPECRRCGVISESDAGKAGAEQTACRLGRHTWASIGTLRLR